MKKLGKMMAAMVLAVALVALTACAGGGKSTDFAEVLGGKTWATYHWYFNEKDGDSGYFTDENYYTWVFADANTFSVSAQDDSFSGTGTLEWTSENQADVYLVLGDGQEQYWTAEFSYSTSHPDHIHFMIQETNFVYDLEAAE